MVPNRFLVRSVHPSFAYFKCHSTNFNILRICVKFTDKEIFLVALIGLELIFWTFVNKIWYHIKHFVSKINTKFTCFSLKISLNLSIPTTIFIPPRPILGRFPLFLSVSCGNGIIMIHFFPFFSACVYHEDKSQKWNSLYSFNKKIYKWIVLFINR